MWMPLYLERLPAVAAIAAISATTISASPAATTAMTAASATAAATSATITAASATTAAAAAFRLGPGLIHHEVAPAEILPVQGIHRAICVFVAIHFYEREASRLSRKAVTNKIDAGRGNTDLREPLLKLIFRSGERKIPNVELLHLPDSFCPEPNCESRSAPKDSRVEHGQSG
jgi:hypothetical protein